ncbi:MAG: hypothetical protein ABSC48_08385 [Terracidiphilus sp.]
MNQTRWFRAFGFAAIALMLSLTLAAQGDLTAIQQKLQQRITLAKLDSNGEIVTAGSVVTLQKNSLQMCATSSPAAAGAPANTYKNGKLSAGMFLWNLNLSLMKIDPSTIPMHTYAAGDKFWIVGMNVKKNGIEFKLWTDADANNIRYWSWLEIPFEKKQIPSPDELMNTIAEVLAVAPVEDQGGGPAPADASSPAQDVPLTVDGKYNLKTGGVQLNFLSLNRCVMLGPGSKQSGGGYSVNGDTLTLGCTVTGASFDFKIRGDTLVSANGQVWVREGSTAESAPAPMPDIAPPPPPPDTPPPTISLGQTMDQVTAILGGPLKVANLGGKSIFYYKDMKVTFTNGKVSNVE